MKRLQKAMIAIFLIMLLMAQSVIAVENTTAEEPKKAESPSVWAAWDVQMAHTYGLGTTENYQGYKDIISGNQFLAIEESFESEFNVTDESKIPKDDMVTRGNVIEELFNIIQLSLKLSDSENVVDEALTYFVNQNLINGRIDGDYALEQPCTNQEMLVFSKRVYDYIIYSLNMDSKGAFWKVSDENNTVYLLGSIHVSDGSVYPMNKEILTAFAQSDELVVEANILAFNDEDTAYVQKIVMFEGDKTIDQLISEETYANYVAAIEPLGVAPEVYNKLKPWYAAILLQNVEMAKNSYNASMGIDVYFLSLATGWKPIVELEGARYQFDMFDSFSAELQENYLMGILETNDQTGEVIDNMLTCWKTGDMEQLESMLSNESGESEAEKEFNEKLFDIRNANMSEKVQEMLTEDDEKDYFVVVGAGHMLKDNGIVESLRNLGYEVEQVK